MKIAPIIEALRTAQVQGVRAKLIPEFLRNQFAR
jgi:hypothetical protein